MHSSLLTCNDIPDMKGAFSLVFLFLFVFAFGQPDRLALPENLRYVYRPVIENHQPHGSSFMKQPNDLVEFNWPQEITVGTTYFDRQSGSSAPSGRMAVFNDGTLGVVWDFAHDTVSFTDQGTAYSYFDGNSWSPDALMRIESVSTINPSLAIRGNGEIIVAARSSTATLHMCSRPTKGSGNWDEADLPLPQGASGFNGPKLVTSGVGHSVIHILSCTSPVSQGGSLYHGQDGALVYQRSTDGGSTWEINGLVPAGMDSSVYTGFFPDTYAFAEPKGNKLAFVVGDSWKDLFLMKSDDDGDTWQKTVIWQHPVPRWNGEATDSIYCPDGSVHLAFDDAGKIHVVFGITRLFSDGSQVFRFPYVGGIGHWMEGLPTWTNGDQVNCLNPDSLDVQGRLASSYLLDWNQNGEIDLLWNFGEYPVGPISFPQIAFDQYGVGMLVMSSVTEGYNNNVQDYRHIWYKYLYQGQLGNIVFDWNAQPQHLSHECVYPSLGSHSPDNLGWPFCYQLDNSPGLAMTGDHDPFALNFINKVDLQYMLPPIFVTVAVSADPTEGGYAAGGCSVPRGSSVSIEAHAYPGWEFVNWTSQNVLFSADSVYIFEAEWNYNLEANFRLIEGRPDFELKGITVSPNPADEYLNLVFPSSLQGQQVAVQLLNITGTQVKARNCVIRKNEVMDVSDLATGLYILKICTSSGRQYITRVLID
jgi:hypothetical protein